MVNKKDEQFLSVFSYVKEGKQFLSVISHVKERTIIIRLFVCKKASNNYLSFNLKTK